MCANSNLPLERRLPMKTRQWTRGLAVLLLVAAATAVLATLTVAGDAKSAGEGDKPLAAGKHDDGLIVEVLEIKPTKTNTLQIRWRYRNPTKKGIKLIDSTVPGGPAANALLFTARKFYRSIYYIEGKFDPDRAKNKAYAHSILVKGKNRDPVAKDLGTAVQIVRPKGEFEIWAQFDLPADKKETTISIILPNTPPIKDVSIQKAD
jgi:hypothetical protein